MLFGFMIVVFVYGFTFFEFHWIVMVGYFLFGWLVGLLADYCVIG